MYYVDVDQLIYIVCRRTEMVSLSTCYRLFPTATACWFWQNIFLQLSDKNIFDDLIENFLVFRLSLGLVGFIIS